MLYKQYTQEQPKHTIKSFMQTMNIRHVRKCE